MLLRWSVWCPRHTLNWKGYLKLSFVSCPVALYPATSAAERVSFRQVNRRTGHRLKQKLVLHKSPTSLVSGRQKCGRRSQSLAPAVGLRAIGEIVVIVSL